MARNFEIITNDEKIKAMGDLLNDEKIDFNYMPPHNSLNFSHASVRKFVKVL
ncbi:hypothetical protein VB002_01170 [Campylobacter concisus]